MENTIKVYIGGSGFHGTYGKTLEINQTDFWDRKKRDDYFQNPYWFPDQMAAIDWEILRGINAQACGIHDCICGSGISPIIEYEGKALVPAEISFDS